MKTQHTNSLTKKTVFVFKKTENQNQSFGPTETRDPSTVMIGTASQTYII